MILALLLQGIPGLDPTLLPGIPADYIPTQGAEQILEIYARTRTAAWAMLGLLIIVSGFLHLCAMLEKMQLSPADVWTRALLVGVLLATYPFIFGSVFRLGRGVAQVVYSDEEARTLNRKFREAAEAELQGRAEEGTGGGGEYESWFQTLGAFSAILNPGTAVLSELILGLFTILFYATVIVMGLFWKVLVSILFCTGPILIVLGALPRFGGRVLGAWICSCVQVSAWQFWMAVCAFMVQTADTMFQPQLELISEGRVSVTNHYEAIAITFTFTFLYWMGPFMIAWLLPISRVSQFFGHAAQTGASAVAGFSAGMVSRGASFGANLGGGGGGGGGGRLRPRGGSGGGDATPEAPPAPAAAAN